MVRLEDGAEHGIVVRTISGHPESALTEGENLTKFTRNCSYAQSPLTPEVRDRLIALVAD